MSSLPITLSEDAVDPREDARIQEQLRACGNLPRHIAIIMDGDRRWAAQHQLPRTEGHRFGRDSVRDIVRACGELDIEILTLYTFSTENWTRAPQEVEFLMHWLCEVLNQEAPELNEHNVRLNAIGHIAGLPASVQQALRRSLELTAANTGLLLNLALNYGGRSELIHAFRHLAAQVRAGTLAPEEIDEQTVSEALYTAGMPDPDLLIRSSGEMRLSNFLPWQTVYTEIWVTPVYWPVFRRQHLYEAIRSYQQRHRRFGGA